MEDLFDTFCDYYTGKVQIEKKRKGILTGKEVLEKMEEIVATKVKQEVE